VALEVTADVVEGDERGERPLEGGFDLASVLAELGRHVVHPDGVEHLRLGPSSDPDPARIASVRRLLLRPSLPLPSPFAEHPVLVDLEAAIDPEAAHADVVGLGAREVVERRAPGLGRDDPQVDVESVP